MSEQKDTPNNNPHQDTILLTPNDNTNDDTIVGLEDFFEKTSEHNEHDQEQQTPEKTSDQNNISDNTDDTTSTEALDIEFFNQLDQTAHDDTLPPSFEINFEELAPLDTPVVANTETDDTVSKTDSTNKTEQIPTEPTTSPNDNNTNDADMATIAPMPQTTNKDNLKKSGIGSLFKKEQKTTKPNKKPSKTTQDGKEILLNDSKKLNMLIIAGIILLMLIAGALYMTMFHDTSAPDTATPAVSTPVAQETTSAVSSAEAAPSSANQTDILPTAGTPNINPDEILNAQIPSDPALVKEEIDRLADTDKQLSEQEKLVKEQLVMMEELTAAKAEQIALLEAQIAELEKQKTSGAAAPTSAAQKSGQ